MAVRTILVLSFRTEETSVILKKAEDLERLSSLLVSTITICYELYMFPCGVLYYLTESLPVR